MRIIAHRGNLCGPEPATENHPVYIDRAIQAGFDVEVDLWLVDNLWMIGHDEPQHIVGQKWLDGRASHLWLHCKHLESLHALAAERSPLNYFWHEEDAHTLTSHGYVWTYPGQPGGPHSVIVDLEGQAAYDPPMRASSQALYGVCTDYPYHFV